jgi:hypothetical protein
MNDIFYFGCRREAGHYLWQGNRRAWDNVPDDFPCTTTPDAVFLSPKGPEVEGLASFCHLGGWTIISFWDRSVDTRGKCNSTFIARGCFDFDSMCAKSREAFPDIWQRFKFSVVMRQVC